MDFSQAANLRSERRDERYLNQPASPEAHNIEEGKCGGRPCIRGLRMRVSDVLELFGAGASFDEILKDYPFLEREDILAAIDYAAHQTDHVVIQAS